MVFRCRNIKNIIFLVLPYKRAYVLLFGVVLLMKTDLTYALYKTSIFWY
jgi:hypothetical protein